MRPILFSLGSMNFFASPIFAGLSAILAALYIWAYRDPKALDDEAYWNLMLWLSVGTLGAGLAAYFVLYGGGWESNLAFIFRHHRVKGGAFYGNYWGAMATVWLFARVWKLPFRPLADRVATAAPLALALMRFGCIQHGCCFGRPSSLPWALVFTDPRSAVPNSLLGVPLHPSQVYEAFGNLAIFCVLHFVVFKRIRAGRLPEGFAFLASTTLYAVLRLTLGHWRGSDPGIFTPWGLTTAQCIALMSLAGCAVLARRWRKA